MTIYSGGSASAVQSVAGRTGAVTLTKADVGLSAADNTADVDKPVSTAQTAALALKAPVGAGQVTGVLGLPVVAEITDTFDHTLTSDHTSYALFSMDSATQGTYEIPRRLVKNVGEIRFLYVNQGAFDITVRCGVGLTANASTVTPGYFGGKRSVVIEPGGSALSDPIPFDGLAGAIVYERSWVSVASGAWKISAAIAATACQAGVDKTASGALSGGGTRPFCAMAVLGQATGSAVAAFGDSITWGSGDTARMVGAGNGYMARACGPAGVMLLNLGKPSETAQQIANDVTIRGPRWRFIGAATKAWFLYGINDLTGGRTVANLQADVLTIAGMVYRRNVAMYVGTVTPKSTSTDSFATTGNQTASNPPVTVRPVFNAWLRAGAPLVAGAAVAVGTGGAITCDVYDATGVKVLTGSGSGHPLAGVFDTAAAVESGEVWRAPVTGTATTVSGSPTITAATGTWLPGMTVTGTGIPAGSAVGTVVGTTLTLISATTGAAVNATASASGVAVTSGVFTADGLHPAPTGHAAMAAAIVTLLLL